MVTVSPGDVGMIHRVDGSLLVCQVDAVSLLPTDVVDVILRVPIRGKDLIVPIKV